MFVFHSDTSRPAAAVSSRSHGRTHLIVNHFWIPFFLGIQLVSALQLCSVNINDERRLTMSSLMFIMLISLLPFPMQAAMLAAEWLMKQTQQAYR